MKIWTLRTFCKFYIKHCEGVWHDPKNREQTVRLGITVGKKIGKAVKRNRAKRVITAAFRFLLPRVADGYDFVIVARTRILNLKSTDVLILLEKALSAAGALKEENETITDISD